MAKRWQKEDLSYLKRYGKTKSIDELAVRFKTDEKTVRAALIEVGVLPAPKEKPTVAFSRPAGPRPEADPLVEQLTKGLALLQKQEWAKAAVELEKVIAGDEPSLTARARQFLAICRQKLAEAKGDSAEPGDPFLEAVMLRNRGDVKAALELARRGGRDKKDERFAFLVASIHAAEGRLDEAAKALGQAIELNPRNRVHAFHDADFAELRRHAEHRQLFELP
jgi:tetratricopeptide (TPR) repeat protein